MCDALGVSSRVRRAAVEYMPAQCITQMHVQKDRWREIAMPQRASVKSHDHHAFGSRRARMAHTTAGADKSCRTPPFLTRVRAASRYCHYNVQQIGIAFKRMDIFGDLAFCDTREREGAHGARSL